MTRISRRVARSPGQRPSLGNAKLAAQTGTTVSALLGGAVVTLSYGHLLWANAILSWIPVLLALRLTEPPAGLDRGKKRSEELKEMLSTTLVRDAATRKRPSLSTLGVSFFDISDRSESRSVTGLVGGSSWPSAGDLTA